MADEELTAVPAIHHVWILICRLIWIRIVEPHADQREIDRRFGEVDEVPLAATTVRFDK
jgi:hypothetical protein